MWFFGRGKKEKKGRGEVPAQPSVEHGIWIAPDYSSMRANLTYDSTAEAKAVLKELRIKKKELAAARKQAQVEINKVNLIHRNKTAGHTAVRGGGTLGRLARSAQSAARSAAAIEKQQNLNPWELRKLHIDGIVVEINKSIARIEADIARASKS